MAAGTENELSFQEYTRYIPGIFKEYTKGWDVDKRLDLVAALPPEAIYSIPALYQGLCLTCTRNPPTFSRDIHVLIFLICDVSSMAPRGAEQASAAALSKKDSTGTKKHKEKVDTESSSDSDEERAAEAEAKRSRERERKCRLTDAETEGSRFSTSSALSSDWAMNQ